MKFKSLKVAVTGFILSVTCLFNVANAGLIYEHSLNTNDFGWNSNIGTQQILDGFTLGSAASVNMIEWYGFRGNSTDPFILEFFNGINTLSFFDETLTATYIDTGILSGDGRNNIFKYSANITSVALAANTTYYLGIKSTNSMIWTWNFGSGGDGSSYVKSANNDTTWNAIPGDMAFRLTSQTQVPEPSTLAIFALGMIGLASRRFKKQS